jgi:hypothetical protein
MDGEYIDELANEQVPFGFSLHFAEVSQSLWTPSASTPYRRGTHGTQSPRYRTGRQRTADSISRQTEESGAHVLLAQTIDRSRHGSRAVPKGDTCRSRCRRKPSQRLDDWPTSTIRRCHPRRLSQMED